MNQFLALLFLVPFISLAAGPEDLINQIERPTMAQIKELTKTHPTNPFRSERGNSRALSIQRSTRVPTAIAFFERAFPGATFYGLGRDAVLLTDILDGFWLSAKQPFRVKRLDASHPSFSGNDELTYGFLRTNGIHVDGIENGFPHVMFDVTSFSQFGGVGGMSQSVQLVRAGYLAYSALHKDPKRLIPHLNFISVGMYHKMPDMLDSPPDLADFFRKQRESTTETGFQFPLFCNLAEYTYSQEWHDIFESFQVRDDGTVFAPHGLVSWESTRQNILAELYDIYQVVSNPKFHKSVDAAAKLLGFNFPKERTTQLQFLSRKEHEYVKQKLAETQKKAREARPKQVAIPSNHTAVKDLNILDIKEAWGSDDSPLNSIPLSIRDVYFDYRKNLKSKDPVIALREAIDDIRYRNLKLEERLYLYLLIFHEALASVTPFSDDANRARVLGAITDLSIEYRVIHDVLMKQLFPHRPDFPSAFRIKQNIEEVRTLVEKRQAPPKQLGGNSSTDIASSKKLLDTAAAWSGSESPYKKCGHSATEIYLTYRRELFSNPNALSHSFDSIRNNSVISNEERVAIYRVILHEALYFIPDGDKEALAKSIAEIAHALTLSGFATNIVKYSPDIPFKKDFPDAARIAKNLTALQIRLKDGNTSKPETSAPLASTMAQPVTSKLISDLKWNAHPQYIDQSKAGHRLHYMLRTSLSNGVPLVANINDYFTHIGNHPTDYKLIDIQILLTEMFHWMNSETFADYNVAKRRIEDWAIKVPALAQAISFGPLNLSVLIESDAARQVEFTWALLQLHLKSCDRSLLQDQ